MSSSLFTEAAVGGFRIYLRSPMHWMWGQLFFSLSTEAAVRRFRIYLRSPMHWMWGQLFFSLSTEAAVRGRTCGLSCPTGNEITNLLKQNVVFNSSKILQNINREGNA
jgi:hypothetical protein